MKQLHYIVLLLLLSSVVTSFIVDTEKEQLSIKEMFSNLIAMPGGTFQRGPSLPYSDELLTDTCLILLRKRIDKIETESFLISTEEVSVRQWKTFYNEKKNELGEEKAFELFYPDTLAWFENSPYTYNEHMTSKYFWHSHFDGHPIIGINWYQAGEYCKWLTLKANEALKEKSINEEVEFRLPTAGEWEYAALCPRPDGRFWSDVSEFGAYESGYTNKEYFNWKVEDRWANFGQIWSHYGIQIKSYASDGHIYPGASKSYYPNRFGLYDMAGNVAEWTSSVATILNQEKYSLDDDETTILKKIYNNDEVKTDSTYYEKSWLDRMLVNAKLHDIHLVMGEGEKKIVKGGSWADPLPYLYCSVDEAQLPNKKTARIGFRVAMTYNPKLEAFYKKLGISEVPKIYREKADLKH